MYNRVFAFGCSFTCYTWPTWADLIGYELSKQGATYYNAGVSGIGNAGIANNIAWLNHKYKITEDDLVLVMWSTWNREDRINIGGGWKAGGHIFNNFNYDENFIMQHWNLYNDVYKNLMAIYSARQYHISFEGSMFTCDNEADMAVDGTLDADQELLNQFLKVQMPNPYSNPCSFGVWDAIDGHPLIKDGLQYVDDIVSPQIGVTLSDETRAWANEWADYMDKQAYGLTREDVTDDIKHRISDNVRIKWCNERTSFMHEEFINEYEILRLLKEFNS